MFWAALAVLICAVLTVPIWLNWRRCHSVRQRTCQGQAWAHRFPGLPKQQIRATLALFGNAFAIPLADQLRLHPADPLVGLYRLRYPWRWMPDNLEFESLHRQVLATHGIDLMTLSHDEFTLGDLVLALSNSNDLRKEALDISYHTAST